MKNARHCAGGKNLLKTLVLKVLMENCNAKLTSTQIHEKLKQKGYDIEKERVLQTLYRFKFGKGFCMIEREPFEKDDRCFFVYYYKK